MQATRRREQPAAATDPGWEPDGLPIPADGQKAAALNASTWPSRPHVIPVAVWLMHVALPLLGLWLLIAQPRLDGIWNDPGSLVGNIGSHSMRHFTAVGDTINLAARLESIAPVGAVVIGAGTRAAIGPEAVVESLGNVTVKGRSEPVEAFLLHALGELAAGPALAAEAGRSVLQGELRPYCPEHARQAVAWRTRPRRG